MKKMNNKGFSLVELIVVVLIMAIIAVALAPQVMKWVDKSRLSADRETYDGLISNVQVALTDKGLGDKLGSAATFTIYHNQDAAISGGASGKTGTGAVTLEQALNKVNASWKTARAKRDTSYSFTVSVDKMITRGSGTGANAKDPAKVEFEEADS